VFDILAITGPIYFAILLGYATTRWGLFTASDMRAFGKFVLNLALPAMLFNALAQRQIAEILNGSYLVAYSAGSLAVLGAGYFWCRRVERLARTASAVRVMGMACSNSGFVGFPILLLIVAPAAGVALALNMIVENFLVIPLVLALAERGRGDGGHWVRVVGQSLLRLARTPMIIGLLAGFLVSVSGWHPPGPVSRSVDLFAMASGALSLFVIGGALVGLPTRGMLRQVAPIVIGKLVLFPLAVLLAVLGLPMLGLPPLDPTLRQAAVLLAAMPMMGIYPILAMQHGLQGLAASALLVATVVSFFTINLAIWMFRNLG
jgi:malonate transporter